MLKLTKVVEVKLSIDVAKCIQAITGLLLVLHQLGYL